jgi:hypothetical protein
VPEKVDRIPKDTRGPKSKYDVLLDGGVWFWPNHEITASKRTYARQGIYTWAKTHGVKVTVRMRPEGMYAQIVERRQFS